MPNVQHPGFYPARVSGISGGGITYKRRRVLTNNTTAIATQDAVVADGNGNILGIAAGAHNSAIASVAMGASYVNASGERVGAKVLPAATLYTSSTINPDNASYVYIVENELNVDFIASADGALALEDLLENFEIIAAAAVNGISTHEVDASTAATTATFPVRLMDMVVAPDNDIDSADARWFFRINAGFMAPSSNATLHQGV